MVRYTVIGAGGFVGSHLVRALKSAGAEVHAPVRSHDYDLPVDLGRVIYCAGLTGDYRVRPFAAVEAHVGLLSRILEAGRFERLVYLSSTRAYQTTGAAEGREDAALSLNPGDGEQLYELSKALGENLALCRSDGRACAARLSYVFGSQEGDTGFLSEWLLSARQARTLEVASTPDEARDYVHIDDVTRALRTLVDSDLNAIVNVASGDCTTNREIAEVFGEEGWRVRFTGAASPQPAVKVRIERLRELGISPRPAREVVRAYLRSL
ncbi:MAG: NAD-dependent epimerase/dehydratase family protein [Phenylobacterium sp.]|uniref:NAD-dependent epimerase/dehydratase family protein n=1 Tax=Phenylobacterium sp. TaxID=1871053 RepID=UPI0025FDDE82|nr:SDR family oxidoreductase [Phenylobacterium sp.]MBI1198260.1 NAD-dependent epimerase/dehydratase family protein [Phenylobacterium sp.]